MTATTWDDFSSADEFVGAQVNQLMFRRKMSRKDLGLLLGGIDGQTAGRKLRGERSWSLDELLAVSRFFEVPLDELMPGDEYAPVLDGRGRSVRHVGLEPTTRCFNVTTTSESLADVVELEPWILRRRGVAGKIQDRPVLAPVVMLGRAS